MRGLDAVDSITVGRYTDAATMVCANAKDGAFHGEKGTLAAGATARGDAAVHSIERTAPDIVLGVKRQKHHSNISFTVEDGAGLEENCDKLGGRGRGFIRVSSDADGSVEAREAEGVFKRDWNAVERADGLAMSVCLAVTVKWEREGVYP